MPARGISNHSTSHSTALHPRKRLKRSSTLVARSQQDDSDSSDDEPAGDHASEPKHTTRRKPSSSKDRRRPTKSRPQAVTVAAVPRARRNSLPRPASPRARHRTSASPVANKSRPSLPGAQRRLQQRAQDEASEGSFTQHYPATKFRRAGSALSALPTNHRPTTTAAMPSKRNRDPETALVAPRMTRRTSGALLLPEEPREESARGRKRKRAVKIISDTEMEEDEEEEDDDEEGDVEMVEERPGVGRRLRSADTKEGGEEDAREGYDEEDSDHSDADHTEGSDHGDEVEQDDYCLYQAAPSELRRLLREELVRLYTHATSSSSSAAATLNKEQLIQGIVDARPDGHEQHAGSSDDDASDGVDSPRPYTSHEASPVAEAGARKAKGSKRRGEQRKHVPTPPPSSDSGSTSQGEDDAEEVPVRNLRALRNRSQSLPDAQRPSSEQPRKGRQSNVEAPRRQLRTRRDSLNEEELAQEAHARELRNGKKVVRGSPQNTSKVVKFDRVDEGDEDEEWVDENAHKTSPVAHRTRHGATPSSPVASPEARPSRAAKNKAVAKLSKSRSYKGKEKAVDQDDEDELVDLPSSDEEEEGDGDEEMMDAESTSRTRSTKASASSLSRRRSKTQQQVETPPSDADEESGAEPDDEQSENGEESDVEVSSHLRGPKQLRNGKVVALKQKRVSGEEQDGSEDEDEGSEDEQMDDVDGEDHGDDVDLRNETSKSLLRYRRDELLRLCADRELGGEGTKHDLVQALLQWRETHDSDDDTASDTSTATARAETKTQALEAIKTARPRKSKDPPLLMRGSFSSSPEKPHSPVRSKADEQEEVNALDLESLQLQDKEIAPDKLQKLEKVGSGGFKDVYKGIYRKKTIAIADIRGHLTDMDIKELGLLRDLRHPNIVHFIGVSIPKEPSSVPVMIVTELCANGDLFDYLRAVPHPSFLSMLEIMLGISRGLEYLHTHKPIVIHRDIKSSNVLITAEGVAKLNDFGLARIKTSTRSMIRSLVGTVNWQAPELWVAHPKYNEKVDVYSVGLVFWEVLQWHQPVKRYPFEGLNEHAIYDQVGHKKIRPSTASMRRAWGGEVVDLVSAMWDQDPAARPPMSQVTLEIEVLMTAEREGIAQEKRDRGRA